MSDVRVYKYHLRPPTEGGEIVEDQMMRAHRYRNVLVEMERQKRDKIRSAIQSAEVGDESLADLIALVSQLEGRLEECRATVKGARAKARKRVESQGDRALIRDIVAELKEARAELREARRARKHTEAETREIADAYQGDNAKKRAARDGCYWGTYEQADAAIEQAAKAPLWSDGEANDPRFSRWDGSGAVSVRIHGGGAEWADVAAGSSQLINFSAALQPARLRNDLRADGSPRRAKMLPRIRMRVSSDGRSPVWAEWPVHYDREVPAGAVLRGAKIVRRRVEARYQWSLHLTLRMPAAERTTPDRGAVAVNIGWRKTDRGIRIATLSDTSGHKTEVLLRQAIVDGFEKVRSLDGIRDRALNELKEWIVPWMKGAELPAWLSDPVMAGDRERASVVSTIHLWRSPARFAHLALQWRERRFPGDDDAICRLEEWRKQDKHLWTWVVHQREKSIDRRREQYRLLGCDLASKYRTLIVDDAVYSQLRRRRRVEDDSVDIQIAKRQQQWVAPGDLRSTLVAAQAKARGMVAVVACKGITAHCSVCGHGDAWDRSAIEHRCSGCGNAWDQDENASGQMLGAVYGQRPDGSIDESTARVKNYEDLDAEDSEKASKWVKRKKAKADRLQTASQVSEKTS